MNVPSPKMSCVVVQSSSRRPRASITASGESPTRLRGRQMLTVQMCRPFSSTSSGVRPRLVEHLRGGRGQRVDTRQREGASG